MKGRLKKCKTGFEYTHVHIFQFLRNLSCVASKGPS